ncbi:LysR family transcriptional regulator [Shuttleworthella satelles]|uniref:LysR family transcriptional regulator n=1 Tax=Shuttleworthella satelles TaxID=177972 RepID=UPI0028D2AD16|nr:LysR family transcriptional regulator [Shuttleworthia satelles]
MDINYELYRVFYYVARTLSFSEASKQLFISQSAVSQSIKTLEKKLDQQLFLRSTKKVSLTPAGEILFKHVEPAINLIMRAEDQLLDDAIVASGQLHIAASDTICRYFLVPYLRKFHQKFPDITIRVTNATSLACADLLEQGKVDLIVCNYPNMRLSPSSTYHTVARFSDIFCGNPNCFDLSCPMTIKEINRFPLMTLEKHSTTSEFLHKLFLQQQMELLPTIRLASNDLLIDLARIGLGIAFVPDFCIKKESRDLVIVDLRDQIPQRQLIVATMPSLPLTPAARAFIELLPNLSS